MECGKLKSDFRYSAESVFDTFPWPQFEYCSSRRESAQTSSPKDQRGLTSAATIAKIDARAAVAREVGAVLALWSISGSGNSVALIDYSTGRAAYGFSAKKDLLAQLLALNLEVAANLEKGSPVTAPGVPRHYPDPQKLVTTDCIRLQGCETKFFHYAASGRASLRAACWLSRYFQKSSSLRLL